MGRNSYLYKINGSSLIILYHNKSNINIEKIGLQTYEAERQAENNIFCQIVNTSKTSFVIFDLLIEIMKSMGLKMHKEYARKAFFVELVALIDFLLPKNIFCSVLESFIFLLFSTL